MTVVGPVIVPPSGSASQDRSILEILQDASTAMGISYPSSVYGQTDRTSLELQRVCNEMARRIRNAHDWQALKVLQTENGDDSTTSFALPADYLRFPKDGRVYSTRLDCPLTHVIGSDDWLHLQVRDYDVVTGAWTILGGNIEILPAPATGEDIKYYYLSRYMVQTSGGGFQDFFSADSDSFRLDARTLELGLIYEWRSRKGLDFQDELADFNAALSRCISDDKGARILTQRSRQQIDARIAYPWNLG